MYPPTRFRWHCSKAEYVREYYRMEFGMAIARRLGIPIVHKTSMYVPEKGQARWDKGVLYLPDGRTSELFHELGHWLEGRIRGTLELADYGLSFAEDPPKVEIDAEQLATEIEKILVEVTDVAVERLTDILIDGQRHVKEFDRHGDT